MVVHISCNISLQSKKTSPNFSFLNLADSALLSLLVGSIELSEMEKMIAIESLFEFSYELDYGKLSDPDS